MSDEKHEQNSLSDWLDADQRVRSERHECFDDLDRNADALVVHGLLRDMSRHEDAAYERRITQLLSQIEQNEENRGNNLTNSKSNHRRANQAGRKLGRRSLALAGASLAACLLGAFFVSRPSTLSAAEALEKIIQSATRSVDRAYEIHVLEDYQQRRRPGSLSQQWPSESIENVDGAMLYVGGTDRHVFVRKLKDGRERKSGCDGTVSWAFREDGPVHVSDDLSRFRGKVPGQQQSMVFTDLYSQLTSLRDGYDVELTQAVGPVPTGRAAHDLAGRNRPYIELHRLAGHRKSREVRGPKSIEILFDQNDGTIHRMILDGLPRGHGGPKKVELALVSQEPRSNAFYSHTFHRDAQRKVKREEAKS